MTASGLRRDVITYSALISALSKGREWQVICKTIGVDRRPAQVVVAILAPPL